MGFFDSISDAFKSVGNGIGSAFGSVKDTIGGGFSSVFNTVKGLGNSVYNSVLKPVYNSVLKPVYNGAIRPVYDNVIRPVGNAGIDKIREINHLTDTVLTKGDGAIGGLLDFASSPIFFIVAGVAGIVVLNKVL